MFHGFTFASHFKLLRELFEKLKLVIKINENLKFHVLIFFIISTPKNNSFKNINFKDKHKISFSKCP